MTAAEALAVLLSLFAHVLHRDCLDARRDQIVTDADEASRDHHVPVALLLATGFAESHLGCAPASGGCWGAPRDREHRRSAGRADHAASALALGQRRCGSWPGAVAHFRCGRCVCSGTYPARVVGLWRRIEAHQ